jgi:hypothetical protein
VLRWNNNGLGEGCMHRVRQELNAKYHLYNRKGGVHTIS